MTVIYVGLAAFVGGIVVALLGYFKSGEPFIGRKFLPSILTALIAGFGVAFAYPLIDTLGFWTGLVGAFLVGAGVDVGLHRLIGAIKK